MGYVMTFRHAAVLSLCVALLVACSLKLKIGVINNVGELVTISSGDEAMQAPPGHLVKFFYPTIAHQRMMRVSVGKCTYTYVLPDSIESYSKLAGFEGVVVVQLEHDYRFYLIPPKSMGVVSLADVASIQGEGFPLSPSKQECQ